MITFMVISLILAWIDTKLYELTGEHIPIILPILTLALILPGWVVFPVVALYIIKKVIEWKH